MGAIFSHRQHGEAASAPPAPRRPAPPCHAAPQRGAAESATRPRPQASANWLSAPVTCRSSQQPPISAMAIASAARRLAPRSAAIACVFVIEHRHGGQRASRLHQRVSGPAVKYSLRFSGSRSANRPRKALLPNTPSSSARCAVGGRNAALGELRQNARRARGIKGQRRNVQIGHAPDFRYYSAAVRAGSLLARAAGCRRQTQRRPREAQDGLQAGLALSSSSNCGIVEMRHRRHQRKAQARAGRIAARFQAHKALHHPAALMRPGMPGPLSATARSTPGEALADARSPPCRRAACI